MVLMGFEAYAMPGPLEASKSVNQSANIRRKVKAVVGNVSLLFHL